MPTTPPIASPTGRTSATRGCRHARTPLLALLGLLLIGLLVAPAPALQPTRPDADPIETAGLRAADPALDARERMAAVQELIEAGTRARTRVKDLLADPASRPIVLGAVAQMSVAPRWLLTPLSEVLETAPTERAPIAGAMASIRSRDAASLLVDLLAGAPDRETAEAVGAALSRLTGRTDLGTDADAWRAWRRSVRDLSEARWNEELVAHLAGTTDASRREQGELIRRLRRELDARLVTARDTEQRSIILTEWLADPLPEVRRFAASRVMQELDDARPLNGSVADASLRLLQDPLPDLRLAGATIVLRLAPGDPAQALATALVDERSPGVAGSLLRAIVRWPSAAPVDAVVLWIGSDTQASAPAIDALRAMDDASRQITPEQRERAIASLRAMPVETLSTSAIDLLGRWGDGADRDRLAPLVRAPSADRRRAAARAMLADASCVDLLLSAIAAFPDLAPDAGLALARHRPGLEGYLTLLGVLPDSGEAGRQAVFNVGRSMGRASIVTAARRTTDPVLRVALLRGWLDANATDADGLASSPKAPPELTSDHVRVGVRLALIDAEVQSGQSEQALADLATLRADTPTLAGSVVAALRVEALIGEGRIEDAMGVEGAPADAWIRSLERLSDRGRARQVADVIRERYAATLPPTMSSRFARATSTLDEADAPAPADAAAPSPAPTPIGATPEG